MVGTVPCEPSYYVNKLILCHIQSTCASPLKTPGIATNTFFSNSVLLGSQRSTIRDDVPSQAVHIQPPIDVGVIHESQAWPTSGVHGDFVLVCNEHMLF